MRINAFRLIAAGCALAYLIVFLLLPFVSIATFNINGAQLMSSNPIIILVLLFGMAMIACSLLCPKIVAAIVDAVGAMLPLGMFFIVKNSMTSSNIITDYAFKLLGNTLPVFSIGIGVYVALILGCVAAILSFLADEMQHSTVHSAGFSADGSDDF